MAESDTTDTDGQYHIATNALGRPVGECYHTDPECGILGQASRYDAFKRTHGLPECRACAGEQRGGVGDGQDPLAGQKALLEADPAEVLGR